MHISPFFQQALVEKKIFGLNQVTKISAILAKKILAILEFLEIFLYKA